MKRGIVIALVVVWAIVALAAVWFIIANWNGGSFNLVNFEFGMSGVTKLLKEESVTADGVATLEISTSYDGIELVATDSAEFRVIQYGSEDASEDALFKAVRSGDKLTVSTKHNNRIRIGIFFSVTGEEKLVIEVPSSWKGSVSLETSSGSVKVLDEFSFEDVKAGSTSGSVRLSRHISAASLKLESSSGSIRLEDGADVRGSFETASTSGSIKFSRRVSAASMKLKSSSGSIRLEDGADVSGNFESGSTSGSQTIDGPLKTGGGIRVESSSGSVHVNGDISCAGDLYVKTTSGSLTMQSAITAKTLEAGSSSGGIRLGNVAVSESFNIGCTSGSIHINGISGQGRIKSSSGGITAELMNPVGDVSASSTSGSVHLTVPRDLSFSFEADTSSGSIRTDFEVLYRSDRKNSAVATVGNNPTALIRAEASSGSVRVNLK